MNEHVHLPFISSRRSPFFLPKIGSSLHSPSRKFIILRSNPNEPKLLFRRTHTCCWPFRFLLESMKRSLRSLSLTLLSLFESLGFSQPLSRQCKSAARNGCLLLVLPRVFDTCDIFDTQINCYVNFQRCSSRGSSDQRHRVNASKEKKSE